MGEQEATKPAISSLVERIEDGKVFRVLQEYPAGYTPSGWAMLGLLTDGTQEQVVLSPESLYGNAPTFKHKPV